MTNPAHRGTLLVRCRRPHPRNASRTRPPLEQFRLPLDQRRAGDRIQSGSGGNRTSPNGPSVPRFHPGTWQKPSSHHYAPTLASCRRRRRGCRHSSTLRPRRSLQNLRESSGGAHTSGLLCQRVAALCHEHTDHRSAEGEKRPIHDCRWS